MPKFQDNTGFKMPGVGSKNKHTTSNFREDDHVDKMGYCDTTPGNMLPADSSPMQYTTAKYTGKADFGTKKADTPEDNPVKYTTIVDDDPYSTARYSGNADFGTKSKKKAPEKKTTSQLEYKPEDKKDVVVNPEDKVDINLGGESSGSKDQRSKIITEGSDQGNTGVSYEEGYKDADKIEFPTLASFKAGTKAHWSEKNSNTAYKRNNKTTNKEGYNKEWD